MSWTIKVGGVPEHFNSPWQQAESALKDEAIEVQFTEYPGGTGAMCAALVAGEVDVALLLTEGAVAHALNNNEKIDGSTEATGEDEQTEKNNTSEGKEPDAKKLKKEVKENIRLVGFYVDSPLYWGVHVGAQSPFNSFEDLTSAYKTPTETGEEMNSTAKKNQKPVFAISRYGSGSHLMSYVLMQRLLEENELDLQFEVVKNLAGAREALPSNGQLVFLWEKFMTAPFVEKQEFKRLGDQPTPWPCFVIAIRESFLATLTEEERTKSEAKINKMLEIVKKSCESFKNGGEETVDFIHEKFGIEKKLVAEWLKLVSFKCVPGLTVQELMPIAKTLFQVGKLNVEPTEQAVEELILKLS